MYYTDEIELYELHSNVRTHKAKLHCGLPAEMRKNYLQYWLAAYMSLQKARAAYPELPDLDPSWNWSKKLGGPKNWSERVGDIIKWPQEILPLMCVECNDMNQGMMMLNTGSHQTRLTENNEGLVYVEYLEVAPWNNRAIANEFYVCSEISLRGVGSILLSEAIKCSFYMGNQGRVGLHALPLCTQFYDYKFRMVDLGPDEKKSGLHYYELSTEAAEIILNSIGERERLYFSKKPQDSK